MIKERKPGKRVGRRWVVTYRDETNERRYVTCRSLEEAKRVEAERFLEPGGNPVTRVRDVARTWLAISRAKVREQTAVIYEMVVRRHVIPTIGDRKMAKLRPSDIELLLVQKLDEGYSPKTVSVIQSVVYGICKRAERDGLLTRNPAQGLTGDLRLRRRAKSGQRESVKGLTPEEVGSLLAATEERYPHLHPLFYVMVSTGVRIGEALALRWDDLELEGTVEDGERVYSMRIERNLLWTGRVDRTKSDKPRSVDVDSELRDFLVALKRRHQELFLQSGGTREGFVFQRPKGGYLRAHSVDRQFKTILRKAGLPEHLTPHCLRHTFAALHIRHGADITYVKEQLGHSSIAITYDVYGHWLNKSNREAAHRLQEVIRRGKKTKKIP